MRATSTGRVDAITATSGQGWRRVRSFIAEDPSDAGFAAPARALLRIHGSQPVSLGRRGPARIRPGAPLAHCLAQRAAAARLFARGAGIVRHEARKHAMT